MTRSGAAAVNLPKCQYQMAFLHEKSVNKVTETNLSQPSRRSPQRFLQKKTIALHFLALAAAIAAFSILQRKVQNTKKTHRFDATGCTRSIIARLRQDD